jgi:hypothetical protein
MVTGEFGSHGRHVPSGALHSAQRQHIRKYSDDRAHRVISDALNGNAPRTDAFLKKIAPPIRNQPESLTQRYQNWHAIRKRMTVSPQRLTLRFHNQYHEANIPGLKACGRRIK